MYDLSFLHLRLNILGSSNFSSYDRRLSYHRDYFPLNSIQFLCLPLKVCHLLDMWHVTWPVKHQSAWSIPAFFSDSIVPSGNCSPKEVLAALTEHLQCGKRGKHFTYIKFETGSPAVCRGCLYSYCTPKGPKTQSGKATCLKSRSHWQALL